MIKIGTTVESLTYQSYYSRNDHHQNQYNGYDRYDYLSASFFSAITLHFYSPFPAFRKDYR